MKTVLITGSNSGFGLEMTIELIKKGYFVVATMRDLSKKEAIIEKIGKEENVNNLLFLELDVTDKTSIEQLIINLNKRDIKINTLVNNAGYCQGGFLEELSLEEYQKQFDTNFFGAVALTKEILPYLKESVGAKIINISSISGIIGLPGMSAYSSSKFALEGFSESLRLELAPYNIHVSLIEPASYKTKIWDKGLEKIKEDKNNSFRKKLYFEAKKSADTAADPKEIAYLVYKICETDKPKLRYPLGKSAHIFSVLKKTLSWELIEKAVKKKLGKGGVCK